jgi:splicing factor U2AF subunit
MQAQQAAYAKASGATVSTNPALTAAGGNGTILASPALINGLPGMGMNPYALISAAAPVGGALTKQQREIYIGNLPPGVTVPEITDFMNVTIRQLGLSAGAPVGSVVCSWVSTDGHYAFVELRTVEEASASMAYLTGLQIGTYVLKVGRPKAAGPSGIVVPMLATPFTAALLGLAPHPGGVPTLGGIPMPPVTKTAAQLGVSTAFSSAMNPTVSVSGPSSNVIMVSNLPLALGEVEIKELLSPFGPV